MVVGGLDGGERNLRSARDRAARRIEELVPYAEEHDVRLVLEPLHPMYAADRAVLSTLRQALDVAAPYPARTVGVVVDTFHVWWDPELPEQIARAGEEDRLASYQVCDFNLPIAADALLSRGMMGDGVVDFESIGRWVTAAGYAGPVEVEIFNAEIWASDPDEVLATMKERWTKLILPSLT
jgi:sugar phosphate isomerase/epimerase